MRVIKLHQSAFLNLIGELRLRVAVIDGEGVHLNDQPPLQDGNDDEDVLHGLGESAVGGRREPRLSRPGAGHMIRLRRHP